MVIGGAGFIESNLCEDILNMVYGISCLGDLSTYKHVTANGTVHVRLQYGSDGDMRLPLTSVFTASY